MAYKLSDVGLHNRVKLVQSGAAYFEQLQMLIASARYVLHFQTYIFEFDETGQSVLQCLKEAANRGVKVYLMLDAYGSNSLTARWTDSLPDSGIQFRWFSALWHTPQWYLGRRLHHKVVVADGTWALVGGINIGNRYNDMPGCPAWLDWALYVEGETAARLHDISEELWSKNYFPAKSATDLKTMPRYLPVQQCRVKVSRNDWVRRHMDVAAGYFSMLRRAKDEVIMVSSYFLPGSTFRKAMRKAVKRGVKMQVIVAGKSDVGIAKYAERHLYRSFLRWGIRLYEYKLHVVHAKLSVCDGQWVTVGSFNINDLSTFASIELNLEVTDPGFATEVSLLLHQIIFRHCDEVTWEASAKYNAWYRRLIQALAYRLLRLSLFVFTFYYKQQRQT
jgi:cardiolipin synthase